EFKLEQADIAAVDASGFVRPMKDGTTNLIVTAGKQTVKVPVKVLNAAKPHEISFRREVIAGFNVDGCNQGACHGTPSRKDGFKLSLRGYDPAADYIQLTRDVLGRRTSASAPEASLIIQKALGRVPHEGGQRYGIDAVPLQGVLHWVAEGLKDDPA